ncbi:MAG TPA: PRC-barrel domain-containing protein [Anaerolineae bacterium]|nr:PRC-barrel domain-containing protein [Anaerolineae bacterium]HMR65550.1 PRC-barrel domain-containing protein [Anaerolineae bacterium]
MQFKEGVDVYTTDDQKVGRIERIVLNPKTDKVTHLVVSSGFIFTQEKLIPVDLVTSATEERVTLERKSDNLPELPNFTETAYIPATHSGVHPANFDAYVRPMYYYPPIGTAWWHDPISPHLGYHPQVPYAASVEQQIPEGTVALKEGAQVISADEQRVGSVERVFMDEDSERVTHFLISKGLLLKTRKLVPTLWVDAVSADEVWLNVDAGLIKDLPDRT